MVTTKIKKSLKQKKKNKEVPKCTFFDLKGNESMKDDSSYFYENTPLLDIEHFVSLLLVTIGIQSSKNHYLPNVEKVMATLPTDYKASIASILYEENGWGMDFSSLIDTKMYYEHQSEWEEELSNAFNRFIENHSYSYDFSWDTLSIEIPTKEVLEILKQYDKTFLTSMDHFAYLLVSSSKNRHWELMKKEAERSVKREYVRVSASRFSNSYTID